MSQNVCACRACGETKLTPVLSLGNLPRAQGLLVGELVLCPRCALVQTASNGVEGYKPDLMPGRPEMTAWHARQLSSQVIAAKKLRPTCLVIDIGSGDGDLLKCYQTAGIAVLGIEADPRLADRARREQGVPTWCRQFDKKLAMELEGCTERATVVHAHNVLPQVSDLNAFTAGLAIVLKTTGLAVVEVPYVKDLIDRIDLHKVERTPANHFSLTALVNLFSLHKLVVHDLERTTLCDGSLRVFVGHSGPTSVRVTKLLAEEATWGVQRASVYCSVAEYVARTRFVKVA